MRYGNRTRESQRYGQYARTLLLIPAIILTASFCVDGAEIDRNAAVYAAVLEEAGAENGNYAQPEKSGDGSGLYTRPESAYEKQQETAEQIASLSSQIRVIDCSVLEKEPEYQLSTGDYETLLKIVEAEAGGEDENGKLLVANVVLNRVNSSEFPDTVTEVVYQKEKCVYQFSPVKDGRLDRVEISEETRAAVERAVYGEDISQGALYFMARNAVSAEKLEWFDSKLTWLFAYGGHEFFE